MNTRLARMIDNDLIPDKGGVWIDDYNQRVSEDVAGTITTRIDSSNHYWVTEPMKLETEMEEPKIMKIGSYVPNGLCAGQVVGTDGIAPTVMENHGMGTAVVEPLIQPLAPWERPGEPTDICPTITTSSFEQNNVVREPRIIGYTRDDKGGVLNYHEREVAGTLHTSSGQGGNTDQFVKEPLISVHPLSHALEFKGEESIKEISPALRATDYKCPHCVYEPEVARGCYDNQSGDFARTVKTDRHNAVQISYRIRRLTTRECFRLMDVDDADIDKIDACRIRTTTKNGAVKEKPIPKSAKYKLAGNSICVNVLTQIFRCLFIPGQPENDRVATTQLTIFDI